MVVVAALGRALGVATRPGGHIHRDLLDGVDRLGAQQRVAQLEQRIGAAGEASVQLVTEGTELREGGS
jgi:hypothetical protein